MKQQPQEKEYEKRITVRHSQQANAHCHWQTSRDAYNMFDARNCWEALLMARSRYVQESRDVWRLYGESTPGVVYASAWSEVIAEARALNVITLDGEVTRCYERYQYLYAPYCYAFTANGVNKNGAEAWRRDVISRVYA